MPQLGLKPIDLAAVGIYIAAVIAIGLWSARRVKDDQDFFLGGRKFGKGLLLMHWLCTGTHSEHAVQVAGAVARVGLGGIWYQWLYLFSTPFYWLLAPVFRRLRVTTTGDFFRLRYGTSCEMLYSFAGLGYVVLSVAMLLRGAASAITGATNGAIPTHVSILFLAALFSVIVVAGGLIAAAYTDVLQGFMIILLSVMLIPGGLRSISGMTALHERLPAAMFSITAPSGVQEGNVWFVVALSVLGLVGIGAQPHVMSTTGSGKRELESRVGMCYGNFIKRLLTIAWAFTGLIAIAAFPGVLQNLDGAAAASASETLYGRAIQEFLGDGWRGLMIACLIAGVTSAETFIVTGSAIFTYNLYQHVVGGRGRQHYLKVARVSSAGLLAIGVLLAILAPSITRLLMLSVQLVGLLGAAFWLGVTWRRTNTAGVWASFLGGLSVWILFRMQSAPDQALEIACMLGVEFALLIGVSLLTAPEPVRLLDPLFARLLVPVGSESEYGDSDETLSYAKSSKLGYTRLRSMGFEIPRMAFIDWGGFLAAWVLVAALIGLFYWLSTIGSPVR